MRRRRSTSTSEEGGEAEINLTPLIDVVFVVLIMFIIVAPLLEIDRIHLASGPSKEDKPLTAAQEMSQVHLHVRADNTVLLNGRALVLEQLREQLKLAHLRSPRAIPQLFHDKRAFFGTYQEVKNAVEEAGFEELEIVLQPKYTARRKVL